MGGASSFDLSEDFSGVDIVNVSKFRSLDIFLDELLFFEILSSFVGEVFGKW